MIRRPRTTFTAALLAGAAVSFAAPAPAAGGSVVSARVVAAAAEPAPVNDGPADDAFYQPPERLPPGEPGSLIRAEPVLAPPGAQAWRVLSRSGGVWGDDVAVPGFVTAPASPAPTGGRPVVTWAHGTSGLADACAPSKWIGVARHVPWIGELLEAGYVVAATDYEGIGPPGIHPYLVGRSEGRSVLDAARVAQELPTGANRRVAVFGHSQGGHAALFAGEIARRYAPELDVRGVAAGAPVSDVGAFLDHTVETPGTVGFLVMGATGYRAAYPELVALPLLSSDAQRRSDVAVFGCSPQVMEVFAKDDATTVFDRDPRTVPEWQRRLRQNTAGRRRSAVPVLVWQGDDDSLTPAPINAEYADRACAKGTPVDYRLYPGTNHVTILEAAHDDVLRFLATRLAGEEWDGVCSPPADAGGVR